MKYAITIFILLLLACASGKVEIYDTPGDQYEYAKKLYAEESYTSAAEAFQTVIFRFHGTSLADSVTYYIGMCYYNQKDYILAVSEYKRLRSNYPNSPLADDAHYMIAKSYFMDSPNNVGLEQDAIKDAIREVDNFFEDFPNSPFRQNARDLLDSCYSRIAHKDYENGEVYFKLSDYRAAKVYFEEVVTKHNKSKWVGKALFRLAEIDMKEKNYDDSKTKFTNFLNAFPDHEWAEKAKNKLNKVQEKISKQKSTENERAQD
jgi:outer membrane protein assembly factor BamD